MGRPSTVKYLLMISIAIVAEEHVRNLTTAELDSVRLRSMASQVVKSTSACFTYMGSECNNKL